MSRTHKKQETASPTFVSLPPINELEYEPIYDEEKFISISIQSHKGNIMDLSIPESSSHQLSNLVARFLEGS